MTDRLSAELLLAGYAQGIFPMAESRENPQLHWFDPAMRGIVPLENFHISRSLAKHLRRGNYTISTNRAFRAVVEGCADRDETWINGPLFALYDQLHAAGFAHSLEVWQDGDLAGGIFGITLGGAFFGESMFSRRTNASKTALAYLVDRLRQAGFSLFDTQYITPHLASLGAVEIPRADYRARLARALRQEADFDAPELPGPHSLLQRMTQTS
ncbi:leucyl/phenylalanyl-tRNA--protein transferase [Thioclava sp. L04-15]|uniref:leucyl/phenylalanyl-tRNA--protein transferase n=1 Tax=Thioclava sp. L04-15 TaxID=1915318 RepID=UPI0009968C19|nr:leucyl/phenylalanyl-tRNA--protein transferase [Thioclava sp. L04-15]OOY28763.1 leucyl/phenylalanyl-tRNA--protein transferase [Thioclava sp. L04-15]TNE94460.1 MAG: leucyl/phenylalanyl-tRNA--protein transferase [Paracoccaceae bacterium]